MKFATPKLTIIIPVYKEQTQVVQQTIDSVHQGLKPTQWTYQIVIVNDGSGPPFDYRSLAQQDHVQLIEHPHNKGYGAAIKTGVHHSESEWLAITDADGTYPNSQFDKLIEVSEHTDMVIGIRKLQDVPWLRRLPKFILNHYASFLANEPIADLNSGMRMMRRDLFMRFLPLYPDGFSLTSTITMASLGRGFRVQSVPIPYFKREGKSSIHPILDTYRFFKLVGRLGLHFNPLRIFGPIAAICFLVGLGKGVRDYWFLGYLGNLSVSFLLASLQIYLMGLIAELVSKRI